jgi:Flp pilus assembly protein TadG
MKKQHQITAFRSERGQAMTEFAIVLPVLLLLLLGIVQLGVVWRDYVAVTDAARAGARKAAVSRYTNPQTAGCSTVRSSAADLNQSRLTCTVTVDGGLRPGSDVTVHVTYPYSISLLGYVVAAGALETRTTERME